MLKVSLAGVVGILIGFAAHARWGVTSPAAAAPPVAAAAPACAIDWERMRLELHQALRAERAALPATPAAAPTAAPAPKTPEQSKALAAHAQLLQHVIATGVWSDDDAAALRALIPELADTDRLPALTAIHRAISEHHLRVDARPPF